VHTGDKNVLFDGVNKNNFAPLQAADIPIRREEFTCGWGGKHHPPVIDAGQIVIAVGEGYRSRNHLHVQDLYPVDIDTTNHVALVVMRKRGDLYGSGQWAYVIGVVDGAPFICQVPKETQSLKEAWAYLKPILVKRAEEAGLIPLRQGDWYFVPVVPVDRRPRGDIEHDLPLVGNHMAQEMIRLRTVIYVRGAIVHSQHGVLVLGQRWHKAVRNKAIRTGRLARGGGAD